MGSTSFLSYWIQPSMQSTSSDVGGPSSLQRAGVILLFLSLAVGTFTLQFFSGHVKKVRKKNKKARSKLFKRLGLDHKETPRRTVIGFFHPYW
jgi:hypothetical protein